MDTFIEQVKNHPCLWDTDCVAYRDAVKKDLAWKLVAQASGLRSAAEAKNQWKKLRDSHREAMRRRKTASAVQSQNIGPWKYEKQMEFIVPQNRENYTNHYNDSYVDTAVANLTTEESEDIAEAPCIERYKRRKQKHNEREKLRQQIYDENRLARDALFDLFSSMCQKTRDLPKNLQLRIQREIFEAVTRAEEEALSYEIPEPSTSYYNSNIDRYRHIDACDLAETKYKYADSPSPSTSLNVQEE